MGLLAGFPPASGPRLADLTSEWEALPGCVLGGFRNLYNARVLRVPDSDYPYRMWLFGWAAEDDNPGYAGADAVFHARSRDLRAWEVYAGEGRWDATGDPSVWVPVLCAGTQPWDNIHAGDPSVVLRDGVYHMAYSSVGFDGVRDAEGKDHTYVVSCVMGATSPDGIHWTRSSRPILAWSEEFRNRWEIVNGKIGDPPPDYYGSYHRPSLLWDKGRWRLWFDYFVPGTFVSMGYAENEGDFLDPSSWQVVRAGDRPLIRDWPNPSVVRVGDRYMAFSDAPGYPAEWGGDSRQTTVAESPDGIEWTVTGHLRPWGRESCHVPEAFVDAAAEGGPWLYLFVAWKPDVQPWDYRYKEVRVLRKHIGGAEDGQP
jgi:hypothetical protein